LTDPAPRFDEDSLVEQPALALLAELGWRVASGAGETFGPQGSLGRETRSDVLLWPVLRAALARLNPQLPTGALEAAVQELARDRGAMPLPAANRELWALLRDGVPVQVTDADGARRPERARVVDWDTPQANDFLAVNQLTITGALYTCRPDVVGFVNGLPWLVIEFKKPGVPARQAFDDNLSSYKHALNGVPPLFWSNALLIASNGTESRVGSLTADWERFFEWKRVEREDEPRRVSLDVLLRGVAAPARLIDLAENFTLTSEHKAGLVKIVGQNHQVLGVNNAIRSMQQARAAGHGRGGVFWQTQGSGKSYSMVFFAQKVLRKLAGDWTFVVVTDRVELDVQIARTFAACGALADDADAHAASGAQLRELLAGNRRYVFTLIHKFQTPEVLCERRDVIVLVDEAHRSQYDTLALNMRAALPHAMFMAFTGTPLIASEERTREVFGDYVSIYDFQQSVEDGATVPLFYENRTPELHLANPDFNEQIYALIEEAELSEDAERRLERELARQYHLITRDERLDTVARDIVRHFLGRGFQGKAMVVAIDKATALRMHDKVRRFWAEDRAATVAELGRANVPEPRRAELDQRLRVLDRTEMALVVSAAQNEVEQMASLGLDIVPHRKRINDEDLDEKFKNPNDPLGLVFVCAMWLTGFDAPSVSTVYLDKPMRNHTLMQTIARANRVFPGKHSGLIVDYANVFASLEKALAIYGQGRDSAMPVRDKAALARELDLAVANVTRYCDAQGVDLAAIETTTRAGFLQAHAMAQAADRLMAPEERRRAFLAQEAAVGALFRALKPDPVALSFAERCACLAAIGQIVRQTSEPPDISAVMEGIRRLLDESIAADPFRIGHAASPAYGRVDLSKIDFAALARRFEHERPTNTDLMHLKAAVKVQLERMVLHNPTRADYLRKFEQLIEAYNAGSRNIEEVFKELIALSGVLTEEQTRHVRENLSEEELTIFDILTRPAPVLTTEERTEVKRVAASLLARLHQLLVLGWRQKMAVRAKVRLAIEDLLDDGLPRAYGKEMFAAKVDAVFDHVYRSYGGEGDSVFRGAP
jgi:type I restriction enzyme, R subunit